MYKLHTFSKFSRLKPNKRKGKTAGTVVPNGIQVILCGMKYVDLNP